MYFISLLYIEFPEIQKNILKLNKIDKICTTLFYTIEWFLKVLTSNKMQVGHNKISKKLSNIVNLILDFV